MNFQADQIPTELMLFANCLALVLLIWRGSRVNWGELSQSHLTGWLGATTLLAVLWQVTAGIRPGLSFHLLGASALTLIAGRDKALIGFAAILAVQAANGKADWAALGLNWLTQVLPAVCGAGWLLRWSERRLPANYFVYFFVNGFFGAALCFCVAVLVSLATHAVLGSYSVTYLLEEVLPYYLLFAWSEAFSTGLVLAPLVMFRPQWVETFDDRRYLHDA
ncbi:energy-coupling factor ABC transporter permease [Chitinimonas lacunae]|uniref:Energy-coupling factor ABC transporter permease n=1 Tax=Chitinimonas lacunae TaxID=1963018 RepID=A0ABV8MW49_9NEIS